MRVIMLRIPDVLHAEFKGTCEQNKASMNKVLTALVKDFIQERGIRTESEKNGFPVDEGDPKT